jgi:hypothetical protein
MSVERLEEKDEQTKKVKKLWKFELLVGHPSYPSAQKTRNLQDRIRAACANGEAAPETANPQNPQNPQENLRRPFTRG